ncbi:MAG: hypothetical protein Q8N51_19990 [Gammaproteobacteria bacterium]|nr:hypothetical protein [Gammaproteobacteria bacterium]
MKHVVPISRIPRQAQTTPVDFAAVFTLIANVLFTISTAVLAKENSEFPGFNFPTT